MPALSHIVLLREESPRDIRSGYLRFFGGTPDLECEVPVYQVPAARHESQSLLDPFTCDTGPTTSASKGRDEREWGVADIMKMVYVKRTIDRKDLKKHLKEFEKGAQLLFEQFFPERSAAGPATYFRSLLHTDVCCHA